MFKNLIITCFLGLVAIVLGAFGAHALKVVLSSSELSSFETGVRYQMYHAIVLLYVSSTFDFSTTIQSAIAYCFIIGTFLFSFSIYGLVLSSARNKKIKILGPITPLGGLLLVIAWGLHIINCI